MWLELTPEKLLAAMTDRESSALSRLAIGANQTDALVEIAANIAAEWRGGLRRVTVVDSRALYLPDELFIHILADFRYRAFTRLPGMASLLDNLRVEEWRRANTVRDNLSKVSIVAPDTAYAETAGSSGKPGPTVADPDTDSVLGW
jgi:hypothetical protein